MTAIGPHSLLTGRSGGFLGDDRPVDLIDCHGVLLVLLILSFELDRAVELSLHDDLHGDSDSIYNNKVSWIRRPAR
jgi:hypothetical protein